MSTSMGMPQPTSDTSNSASRRRFGGYRGGGQSVPGNEPGGANGMFGRYGQTPDQQPSPAASQQIHQAAQGGGMGQQDRSGNGQHSWGRYGSHAQGQDQQSGSPSWASPQPQIEPQQQAPVGDPQEAPQSANLTAMRGSGFSGGPMAAPTPSYEDAPVWQQPQDQKGPEENSHQNMGYAQTSMAGTAGAPPPQQTSIQATPGTPGPDLTQGGTVSMPGQESSSPGPDLTNGGQTQMPSQGSGWSSPFGQMNFSNNQPKPYAHGGVVTKPTLALLGEDGAEAVVPMGNNPNAHITPGMLAPRYDAQTGPSSLRHPMANLKPVSGPLAHSATNWKRYAHPHAR